MAKSIALDGTAGSGKGTLSKILAEKLNFYHLDTGAIYRTVGYMAISAGVDIHNEKAVCSLLKNNKIDIKLSGGKQFNILNGEDLKNKIRTSAVDDAASVVSTFKEVRDFATSIQHGLAKKHNLIIEGRDIGTVVLPNADYKFFLTAKPEVRAMRRLEQKGLDKSEYQNILAQIKERDERDSTREISPLKQAEDAIYIDNSNLTIEETINLMMKYIK